MYTEKELLKLAGKLARVCKLVLNSNVYNLSGNLKSMEEALNEYDKAIFDSIENK